MQRSSLAVSLLFGRLGKLAAVPMPKVSALSDLATILVAAVVQI